MSAGTFSAMPVSLRLRVLPGRFAVARLPAGAGRPRGAAPDAGIPSFAISTFDTDTLLIPAANLARALEVLRAAGHAIES